MNRARRGRLLLLAFGDFAFNLYWQSVMLFLLFYYTDALELPIGAAAGTLLAASVWDGIANFVAGIAVDRRRGRTRGYRTWLIAGSVPLGLSFVLVYAPPVVPGPLGVAGVFIGHLLFRTAYAAVNVPYLAMTARISADSGDRAFLAGTRMLFGTAAAVLVSLGTMPIGSSLLGVEEPAHAYLGAAVLFAMAGVVILMLVGLSYREADVPEAPPPPSVRAALASLAANRAFVTLAAAMMAMIVAITILNKSVLYYYRYFLHDDAGGQLALASMGVVSAVAVPLWMLLARPLGVRAVWFAAAGLAMMGLALFAAADLRSSGAAQLFLMFMQGAAMGLNFAFWAMLPDTVEWGERETGLRVEGAVFGVAALLQRVAIGVATAILGWSLGSAGYVANAEQSAGTLEAIRWTIAFVPLGFLGLSCLFVTLNPLRRGVHDRVVRELAGA